MSEIEENGMAKLRESIFDSNPSWRDNAFVEPDWLAYMLGYREAADIIVDQAQEFGVDLVVYPVMFLYRHYLEISLKYIFIVLRRYFEDSSDLPVHHKLDVLWNDVRSLMEREWNSTDYKDYYDAIEARITEFHIVDEGSYSFRYPVTKNDTSSLVNLPHPTGAGSPSINLMQVKEVIHEIAAFLEGTVDMVDSYQTTKDEYVDWIQQEYNNSMLEY